MHRELAAKLPLPAVVAPQAAPNSVPIRAAAGCSVPLAQSGTAIADRLAAQERRGLEPKGADSFRPVQHPRDPGWNGGRCRSRTCDPQLVDRPGGQTLECLERSRIGGFDADLEDATHPSGT